MGLDQYLHAKKHLAYWREKDNDESRAYQAMLEALNVSSFTDHIDLPMAVFSMEVMYWRKANAIHEWFVINVQDGDDDCAEYDVSREQLAELLDLCEKVLDDNDLADELLPTSSGFFFGFTDYDEWYYNSLKITVVALKKILNSPALDGWWFTYRASW